MSLPSSPSPAAIVAIPAHDEVDRIEACLAALAMQRSPTGVPLAPHAFEVLVLANNCSDGTAALARSFIPRMPFPLHVVERRLPAESSHAGGARRLAMDLAADRLSQNLGRVTGESPRHAVSASHRTEQDGAQDPLPSCLGGDGILLTTDADSRVGQTWVAANLAALGEEVDAVAGTIDAEPAEYLALGRGFLDRGRLEDRYLARVAELYGRLDPRPHDPWPNHRVHSGASFALTLSAYRAIGGLPQTSLGEDAALAQALESHGFLIRHSLDVVVTTSCRFDSRARGGAGDTMKLRHAALDAPCDAGFEPTSRLFHRVRGKGLLRRLHAAGRLGGGAVLNRRFGIGTEEAATLACEGAKFPFARLWTGVEAASTALQPGRPLRPSHLSAETARLERLLLRLSAEPKADRADNAARGAPLPIAAAVASPR